MSPRAIIEAAQVAGLSLIAVCDHNSAANCAPIIRLGEERSITVIPGLEVTTVEEAHILTLFPDLLSALDFSDYIYAHLPPIMNNPEKLGDQVIVDEAGMILGEVEKYLGAATDISVDDLTSAVACRGGLVVPSHIDRPYAGIIAQLGFLPQLPFDGVEVAWQRNLPLAGGYTPLASSDAHIPELIGTKKSVFTCSGKNAPFDELRTALREKTVIPHYGDR